jgi:hypothetical protein
VIATGKDAVPANYHQSTAVAHAPTREHPYIISLCIRCRQEIAPRRRAPGLTPTSCVNTRVKVALIGKPAGKADLRQGKFATTELRQAALASEFGD